MTARHITNFIVGMYIKLFHILMIFVNESEEFIVTTYDLKYTSTILYVHHSTLIFSTILCSICRDDIFSPQKKKSNPEHIASH